MKRATLVAVALATLATTARSQPPIKAKLMGSPRLGQPAPAVILPAVAAVECRGPSAECRATEFRSSSELGHVLVLAFGGRPDPALKIDWAALSRRADSLGSPRVVLVVVLRGGAREAQSLGGSLGGSLKILADSGGRVHRQFGVSDRDRDWTIFVVADDGILVDRERVNTLADGAWWVAVSAAIRRGVPADSR